MTEKLKELAIWLQTVPEDFYIEGNPFIGKWGLVHIEDCSCLPEEQGIYHIYSEDTLLYIGKSGNIKQRIGPHHHIFPKILEYKDPYIMYVEFPELDRQQILDLEKYYILKNKPLLQNPL